MYRVGVCGHFGNNKNLLNGQTIKTKLLTEELKIAIGSNLVQTVDTHGWKKNPVALLFKCLLLLKNCDNVVILPAHNGVKIFIPLFLVLNWIFHKKLHYVVIGGWLPEILKKNHKLKSKMCNLDGVYVESYNMINALQILGLKNVKYLPNFKRLSILDEKNLQFPIEGQYNLCTFSRVMEEKGIEDAIDVIININEKLGRQVYTLDIYGPVEEKYNDRFEKIKKDFPEYITYKGAVNYNDSVDVLKGYFALLFPTHYKTEGVPGTIIDAYAAGLPVLASNWDSANQIIDHGKTGFIYDFMQKSKLEDLLMELVNNPDNITRMKSNCLFKANEFLPEKVISRFLKYL
ncbi:glycosyltransferase [Neobacillus sp. NPDC058068]|uniref:glycosyltransferase n=1 Tax=Neobacillus sp. NPDC058068 TaxID=3346325 RepID=UPI0036DDB531